MPPGCAPGPEGEPAPRGERGCAVSPSRPAAGACAPWVCSAVLSWALVPLRGLPVLPRGPAQAFLVSPSRPGVPILPR